MYINTYIYSTSLPMLKGFLFMFAGSFMFDMGFQYLDPSRISDDEHRPHTLEDHRQAMRALVMWTLHFLGNVALCVVLTLFLQKLDGGKHFKNGKEDEDHQLDN